MLFELLTLKRPFTGSNIATLVLRITQGSYDAAALAACPHPLELQRLASSEGTLHPNPNPNPDPTPTLNPNPDPNSNSNPNQARSIRSQRHARRCRCSCLIRCSPRTWRPCLALSGAADSSELAVAASTVTPMVGPRRLAPRPPRRRPRERERESSPPRSRERELPRHRRSRSRRSSLARAWA